jgi:hypothetical protein
MPKKFFQREMENNSNPVETDLLEVTWSISPS